MLFTWLILFRHTNLLVVAGTYGCPGPDGAGLNRKQLKVLNQEMAQIYARPALHSFGIFMLGPALLKFGSSPESEFIKQTDRSASDYGNGNTVSPSSRPEITST